MLHFLSHFFFNFENLSAHLVYIYHAIFLYHKDLVGTFAQTRHQKFLQFEIRMLVHSLTSTTEQVSDCLIKREAVEMAMSNITYKPHCTVTMPG